jgi:hypothetical protein
MSPARAVVADAGQPQHGLRVNSTPNGVLLVNPAKRKRTRGRERLVLEHKFMACILSRVEVAIQEEEMQHLMREIPLFVLTMHSRLLSP